MRDNGKINSAPWQRMVDNDFPRSQENSGTNKRPTVDNNVDDFDDVRFTFQPGIKMTTPVPRRTRRNAPSASKSKERSRADDLARHALRSIEAALIAGKDDGKCLQRILCENNARMRVRAVGERIWVPLWR